MSVKARPTTIGVALVGNPNTGKSTVFTALAGEEDRLDRARGPAL